MKGKSFCTVQSQSYVKMDFRLFNAPAELATVIQHCTRMSVRHPVQSQCTRGGRRGGIQKGQGPVVIFVVLRGRMESAVCTFIQCVVAMLVNNHAHSYLSVCLARWGVGQAGSGVPGAGWRGRCQGGGCEGWGDEATACAVPSQRGRGDWKAIQSHAADSALDFFSTKLCALLLFLNQPEENMKGG